jgi:2-phosphosulfolactate phosphatase
MEFQCATLLDCGKAEGTVVVIDVLRAFSTAAYAFAAGVDQIRLVSSVEEAIELRRQTPGALVMGEVKGLPVPGFDFSNSPPQFDGLDLGGRLLIQRTTSGTQGAVRSRRAEHLLAASFANAAATVRAIQRLSPSRVTFVITGQRWGGWGDEDAACADYLESLLRGQPADLQPLLERVRNSPPGRQFTDPDQPDYPPEDLEYCLAMDRFDFAMPVERAGQALIMRAKQGIFDQSSAPSGT